MGVLNSDTCKITHSPVCETWLSPPAVCSASEHPPGGAADSDFQPAECVPAAESNEPETHTHTLHLPDSSVVRLHMFMTAGGKNEARVENLRYL